MNQSNGYLNESTHLDVEEVSEESDDIRILKSTILDLRERNCNKLADLLADELKELREKK
jgi:hypothetical protein